MSNNVSGITYLPFAVRRQPVLAPASTPAPLKSLSTTVATRFAQFRAQRVERFFRRRAEQREVVAHQTPVARIAHKLSKLLALFARSNRPALRAKLAAFFSRETVVRGVRGLLNVIRNATKRLRCSDRIDLLAQQLQQQQRAAQRRAFLQRLFYALARQGRSVLRIKQQRQQCEQVHTFAVALVNDHLLSTAQLLRIAAHIQAQRDAIERRRHAVIIQRAWSKLRRTHQAQHESKSRLLALLAAVTPVLQRRDEALQLRRDVLQQTCGRASVHILHGVTQRLAARHIQRVWRGYCARLRVYQICAWRRKRAQQQVQRARLQRARDALLQPSEREQQQQRVAALRAQSRLQKTPLVPPSNRRQSLTHTYARASLLEPLPLQHAAPRVSALTLAKTQRVPFATFEKICAQHARVTAENLWIAIPVGYSDANTIVNALPVSSSSVSSSILMGQQHGQRTKRRGKRNRYFTAQYDWVPATLLQQQAPSHEK